MADLFVRPDLRFARNITSPETDSACRTKRLSRNCCLAALNVFEALKVSFKEMRMRKPSQGLLQPLRSHLIGIRYPDHIKPGDVIAVLIGSQVSLVLRKSVYADEIMNGEAVLRREIVGILESIWNAAE
ncbi:hypothetical protein CJF32_00003018 [Rutstroemia sp. NJR-2017a WRK4]|nr:hypothetical protein CJF32_00003018 [Rutstroemia sp. NJR-2017a WRK4]